MVDTTFAAMKSTADSPTLVRKILEAVAFVAPENAAPIATLTAGAGAVLQTLPASYIPVGLVTPDGYTFGGDSSTSTVEALGYASPIREDIESATRTVGFTALETWRRQLLEMAYGMDLSGVVPDPATGEIKFDHPDRPLQRFYRLIVIGRDGSGSNEWLRGKFFPRASITEFPEEVWNSSDPSQYAITMSTYVDDTIGTGERDFIAGKAALANQVALGFSAA
jgi:hypothetical protein